ncbi:MAG TPA: hypothetical protein PLZ86_00680 [bacterium]|nr:hypothetical protein [bacterium]
MKKIIFALILVFTLASAGLARAFSTGGFQNPYGIAVDPKGGFIYVSNVNGLPNARDGNGFISRLKGDGTVDKMRFIDGASRDVSLNAPKGMAIRDTTLYVADIEKLHAFDLTTGRFLFDINFGDLPTQHFYGVTLGPDDSLYVADGPAGTVWRVEIPRMHEVTTFATGMELGQPHDVCWFPARQFFMVAGWNSGQIVAFDRSGKRQAVPGLFLRTLEGLVSDDFGNMYVSSTALSAVYRTAQNFALYPFALGQKTPAGLAFNRSAGEIIAASFDGNTVQSFPVPPVQ